MTEIEIGNFISDSIQVYFPWDNDLYLELESKGFSKDGYNKLPLVYSDNTMVTTNQRERRRKWVIKPEIFGHTYKDLEWKETERGDEPIIPAEKPLINVTLLDIETEPKVKFTIIPKVNGKEEYHLEYSSMAAFGKMYTNWVGIYLRPSDFMKILERFKKEFRMKKIPVDIEIVTETRQRQREEMDYIKLHLHYYKFCPSSFRYMIDFFKLRGISERDLPCLVFDHKDAEAQRVMSPFMKLGLVHTGREAGFECRKPQIVMKLAQEKVTMSRRGVKAKYKGRLSYEKDRDSYILVDAIKFLIYGNRLLAHLKEKYSQI